MTPVEVDTLFRIYIDEPDTTFVSDAVVESYLAAGYREFRNFVCDIDPMIYNVSQNITITDLLSYDMAAPPTVQPAFLGASVDATNGRLIRLNNFYELDSSGNTKIIFESASNVDALDSASSAYFLANTVLRFSRRLTGTFAVHYVPEAAVWTAIVTAGFIDDLTPFHDLIALLATKQYAIQDGAASDTVVAQLTERLGRFEEYLRERAFPGVGYVQAVPWLGL